ncbi:predicted protein [Nematostella vectensis]|uniref:Uncharacterized protein n=1 Tax=Nematostella vectensis TaxID=45351 RepID=A7RNY1_NEMVE|nr:predicted protein [Nematostella vectensis]|eukprot:XP_001638821.1 predicted protein [Nematostella vectensis]
METGRASVPGTRGKSYVPYGAGQDLFAREAHFHTSCQKAFNLRYLHHVEREPNPRANDTDEDRREASREMAFTVVVDYIQEHVIREKEVLELSALRSIYVSDLEKAGFPNPQYRGEKLKARLEHHVVGQSINFTKVNLGDRGCICYNLVYSADISVADAIAHGNKLGSVDKYKDVALYLRTLIRQAFMQSHPLPWPPTADELDINVANEVLPSELTNLLNFVLSGSSEPECEKTTRIVSSICQIVTGEANGVFHLEWDNMNKITTNIHGSNVVNSTAGIMVQETNPELDSENRGRTLPLYKKDTSRSMHVDTPETLAPFHIYNRVGPKLPSGAVFTSPTRNAVVYQQPLREYEVWILAKIIGSKGTKQLVPAFGGLVSATGSKPARKSTVEYLNPIHQPFTEYAVIKELLQRSEDATKEVGQLYVFTTFDLGGCMKELPLIWRSFSTESKAILPLCFLKSQFLEEPVDLDELMTYSLTPVPHSLGTPDGFLNKTNKATILHFLTDDYGGDALYPSEKCLYIQDGNALFHALTQLPPTFGEICLQMLDQMVAKKDFIFSTDSYHENSIKSQERIRRGSSPKYIVDGPATRKPAEFKIFLSNDANKVQLYRLLLRVWGSSVAASRLEKCDRGILVVEGKAYRYELLNGDVTTHELHELTSNQEETDTRVILYLKYAVRMGYESAVVRTPDTDILCILMHYAPSLDVNIYLDIGTGKNR